MQPNESDSEMIVSPITSEHPRITLISRLSRRHWQTAPIILLIVLLSALVIYRNLSTNTIRNAQLSRPTPTVTPAKGMKILIYSNVSQGTLTMNGKKIPFTPNTPDQPLYLTSQHVVLTLTEPPFQPITCTIDQGNPPETGGQCGSTGNDNGVPEVDMSLSVNNLPTLPKQQLETFMQQELAQLNTAQTMVPVGEHYSTGTDTNGIPITSIASTPLLAQTWLVQQPIMDGQLFTDCSTDGICTNLGYRNQSEISSFSFTLKVINGWKYYNSAGKLVSSFLPSAFGTLGPSPRTEINVHLTYSVATGWNILNASSTTSIADESIASQLGSNSCVDSDEAIGQLLQKTLTAGFFILNFTPKSSNGCLLAANTGSVPINISSLNPLTDTSTGWFIDQFGAVLSVNDKAHALLPQLSRATDPEATAIWEATDMQMFR